MNNAMQYQFIYIANLVTRNELDLCMDGGMKLKISHFANGASEKSIKINKYDKLPMCIHQSPSTSLWRKGKRVFDIVLRCGDARWRVRLRSRSTTTLMICQWLIFNIDSIRLW